MFYEKSPFRQVHGKWSIISPTYHLSDSFSKQHQTFPNSKKWHLLIGNPNLIFLNIIISINHVLKYLRSSALIRSQQSSNYIYLISSLISMQINIFYMNLRRDQIQVQLLSPMVMMLPLRLSFHLNQIA